MEGLNWTRPEDFWIAAVALILTLSVGRYLFLSGLGYLLCYRWGIERWKRFKIQSITPSWKQIKHELSYSISTVLIFSTIGIIVMVLYVKGHTSIYTNLSEHGYPYLFLTLTSMVVFHDAYFYWTHRLLHTPWFLRKIHSVHHQSVNPTPWAAYSFHPLEALLQSLVVFPIITILPVHIMVFLSFTFLVLFFNVMGHLGFEFFPKKFRQNALGKWITSSTNHNLHHQLFNGNFGYYFTFWDRWLKTLKGN